MGKKTVNEELLDRSIRHSLFFQRFTSGERNNVLKFLDTEVFPDITKTLRSRLHAARLAGIDQGPYTTAWVGEIRESIGNMVSSGYRVAGQEFKDTMTTFAVSESKFQKSLLKGAVPFDVDFRTPSPALLGSIVRQKPIEGIKFGKWWQKLGNDTQTDIMGAIKTGLAQGDKPEKLIKRLTGTAKNGFKDGVYQSARHRAEAVVRTISAKIQTEATYETLLANADTIKGYQFVATLDTRTTTICMGHDGKVYDLKDKSGLPPLHWQCRSTIVAVIKSWEEIGLGDLGLKEPPPAGARASMGGDVPSKLTYPEWLGDQSLALQNDALGPGRADIFRRGKLPLNRFYDGNNRPYSLPQLWRKEELMIQHEAAAAMAQKAAAKKAAQLAAKQEAEYVALREKAMAKKYAEQKKAAIRAEHIKADVAKAELEAKKLAEAQAIAEAEAVKQAQVEALEKQAKLDAVKAQAEAEKAQLIVEQAEHDADIEKLNANSFKEVAEEAAETASDAKAAAKAAHVVEDSVDSLGDDAGANLKIPVKPVDPKEYGQAAKAAVEEALKNLEEEMKEAGIKIPHFATTKKKALKKAYDSAWKKSKTAWAKGKVEDLEKITQTAVKKATSGVKDEIKVLVAKSIKEAEEAVETAVADAVLKAAEVEGAKAAGQKAKAEVQKAYSRLLSKKAGQLSAVEAAELAAKAKKDAKKAYDKA